MADDSDRDVLSENALLVEIIESNLQLLRRILVPGAEVVTIVRLPDEDSCLIRGYGDHLAMAELLTECAPIDDDDDDDDDVDESEDGGNAIN